MKTKVGLLIVDMQVGFYPSPELLDMIAIERQSHDSVVFTRFTNKEDSLFEHYLHIKNFYEGDAATSLLIAPGQDLVITRYGYGLNSEHIGMLKAKQMDAWEIAGVDSDSGVLACAFAMWDSGIACTIRSDLTESRAGLLEESLKIASRNFIPS